MISVALVTYNQGELLKACLESVAKESDEIVLIDLGSTDQTAKVTESFQAKIFTHQQVDYVEKVRNFSVSKTAGDWVLILDPDERMNPILWEKLKTIVSENKFDAVNIPRKNIFFGKWIAHTNWWPDKHVRFFKKGKVKWSDKIHVYPEVDGRVLELPAREKLAIIHLGYPSISDFIQRQSRYSTIEAKNLYDQGIRFSWLSFFWKPVREFLVRFLRHLGFLDGFIGFSLTFLMMIYQMEVQIKLWELEKDKT